MIYRFTALFTACIFLAGCAGQNYVNTFEPVIDMQGVNHAAYETDLSACRQYAVREDPANKAMREAFAGAIAGALVGAAVGSAFGHMGTGAGAGAAYGAVGGAGHGAVTGMRAQQIIVSRCMSGRGYKVLYGGDLAQ